MNTPLLLVNPEKKKPEGKVWTALVKSGKNSAWFWAVLTLCHRLSVPALARLPIFRAKKNDCFSLTLTP